MAPLPAVDPELLNLAGPWYWGPAPSVLRPLADGVLELPPLSGGERGTGRDRPATAGGRGSAATSPASGCGSNATPQAR